MLGTESRGKYHAAVRDPPLNARVDGGYRETRAARTGFNYQVYVADEIAQLELELPAPVAENVVLAEKAIGRLQRHAGIAGLESMATPLLRAEGVGSSYIEGLIISQRRVAQALFDPTSRDDTAQRVVGNIRAMERAIELGRSEATITPEHLLEMHRIMLGATRDQHLAGQLRTSKGWRGGKDRDTTGCRVHSRTGSRNSASARRPLPLRQSDRPAGAHSGCCCPRAVRNDPSVS
jgi:hypothetical protein